MSKLNRAGPGNTTSPLSTISTSGRVAASSADMSGGSATSSITAPGLHWLTSSTRWPNAEVAVTIRSHSPTRRFVVRSTSTFAPGVSSRIFSFSAARRSARSTRSTSLTAAAGSLGTRANRAGRTDDHRPAFREIAPAHPLRRELGRLERRRNRQAVARGHRNRCALRYGDAGIADDFRERTEANDPGAMVGGILHGRIEAAVCEFGRTSQHLSRRRTERIDQAVDRPAGRLRPTALDGADEPSGHVRRCDLHPLARQLRVHRYLGWLPR